jgi:hypothetical protein
MVAQDRIDQLGRGGKLAGFSDQHPVEEHPGRQKMFFLTRDGAPPAGNTPLYIDYHSPSRHSSSFFIFNFIIFHLVLTLFHAA